MALVLQRLRRVAVAGMNVWSARGSRFMRYVAKGDEGGGGGRGGEEGNAAAVFHFSVCGSVYLAV